MNITALTLGDMLAFVGLIVAALALAKPRYILIWRITKLWIKIVAVVILVIGYASPLISMLVPEINNIWDGLSLRALIQASGFIAITLGLALVGFIFSGFNYRHLLTQYTKFNTQHHRFPKKKWHNWYLRVERQRVITKRSARKFFRVCSIFVMRGNYEEVAELVRMNMRPLVRSASQYNRYWDRGGDENIERPKENGSNYSFELLYQLLTDKAFMKHVVTNNRFFIHAIVEAEYDNNEHSYHNQFGEMMYPELVGHLIYNKDSFLYTQRDTFIGSARFANVYDLITDENITRRQGIFPSQLTWNLEKTDTPLDEYADVLINLLERMINSYKENPGSKDLLDNIRTALKSLVGTDGVVRRLAYDQMERKAYGESGIHSQISKVLLHVHTAFSSRLLFNGDDPESFTKNEQELAAKNHRSIYDEDTLTSLMAHACYDLMEDYTVLFSDTDDPDGTMRREAMPFLFQSDTKPLAVLFEKLFWERMFDKAVVGDLEIATNIAGYYPNMLRFIIDYFVPFDSGFHRHNTLNDEINRLKGIMSNELKDALLANKKMGDKLMKDVLLPPDVKVVMNQKNKTVTYYYVNSKGVRKLVSLKEKPKAPVVELSLDPTSAKRIKKPRSTKK
jgi:hypothetical protein